MWLRYCEIRGKYMEDCVHLKTEDITPWHGDIFDHPDYKYMCNKCGREVIPHIHCNRKRCKDYSVEQMQVRDNYWE